MDDRIYGHPVEILSMIPAKSDEDVPVAVVTLRPAPEEQVQSWAWFFDREQCMRLRDTLDIFLNDPESWLYVPPEQQVEVALNDE